MTVWVVIPQRVGEELETITRLPRERAGVMLAGVAEALNGDIRRLAGAIRWVTEDAYNRREQNRMSIRPEGYVAALGEAETRGASCIWVHTHPGEDALPRPSEHDRIVDSEIADLFRLPSGTPYDGPALFL